MTCDTSNTAVGAVLSLLQRGTERPVAFASRSLTPTERKYSVGEREALACVWACERWHMYLYGQHFTLQTDQALTALLATTGSGHKPLRHYRWSERLQAYNFTTQFTPGKENVVADLLSRATPDPSPDTVQDPSAGESAGADSHVAHAPPGSNFVEVMVKDCTACLTSGKTSLPPPPPLQPLPWSHKLLSFWSAPRQITAQLESATFRFC